MGRRCQCLAAIMLIFVAPAVSAQETPPIPDSLTIAPGTALEPGDVARPPGLPSIGKWMISQDGTIAHWLGEILDGKALREPINVIVVDAVATSSEQATQRLQAASAAAGYPIRFGHSTGYRGLIGSQTFPQLPQGRDDAFSNDVFEVTNNHGRLFGPAPSELGYIFIGAFSREEVRVLEAPRHGYASFNQARDDYARSLDRATDYKLADFVDLDNAILGDPRISTGDHDGVAVLLRAGK